MKIMRKIVFYIFIFALFILSSCGKKKTTTLIGANTIYDSKENIPDIMLSYRFTDETYNKDVELATCFGQSFAIMSSDNMNIEYLNEDPLLDTKNNYYKLYVVDENNNKKDYNKILIAIENIFFIQDNDEYTVYGWFGFNSGTIIIPKEYFDKNEGEIHLSVFEESKTTNDEKLMVTIAIKYTKSEKGIKLVVPEKYTSIEYYDKTKKY